MIPITMPDIAIPDDAVLVIVVRNPEPTELVAMILPIERQDRVPVPYENIADSVFFAAGALREWGKEPGQ